MTSPASAFPSLTLPLIQNAARRGEEVALIDGEATLTWNALADRTARLAYALVQIGLVAGERVAILSLNSHRFAETIFAALWAEAIACPLNHRLAFPELLAQIIDSEPVAIIADRAHLDMALQLQQAAPSLRVVVAMEGGKATGPLDYESLIRESPPAAQATGSCDRAALLVYTGGTTGRSKGVLLSHANFWANSINVHAALDITHESCYMQVGPLFHVSSLARMFSSVTAGAPQVFMPRFTPESALAAIEQHRVAVTTFVPTMLKALVDFPDVGRFDLSSLRIIAYGAAPIDETLARKMCRVFPRVDFWQAYGMTETSPTVSLLAPEHHRDPSERYLRSAGRTAMLCEIRICGEHERSMPTGAVGEILVRGPNVMMGYWRNDDLTRQALQGGWLHTGDLGYLDEDGYLFIVDRKNDMIISGGENIHTVEVENALSSHPDVRECAVIGLSDPVWGQVVHAVVIPRGDRLPTLEELQTHCRSLIAGYKLPRSLDLRREPMPLSGANKVLKAVLQREAEERRRTA